MPDAYDISSLYGGDDAASQQRAQALAALLRQQQIEGGLLSRHPLFGGMGQGLAGQAVQGQEAIAGLPEARLKMAIERLKQQKEERAAASETDPATTGLRRALARQYMPQQSEAIKQAPGGALSAVLPQMENYAAKKAQGDATAAYRQQIQQDREEARKDKRWTQFGDALDPTKARAGEMGKMIGRVAQAGAAKAIVESDPNPNAQRIYELARAYDRLVSGGVATAGATSHLVPQTALGSVADFTQWLTNSPVGRNQQAFVAQMLDGINREEAFAKRQIKEWQGRKASRFSDLAKADRAKFESELQNWGLDPEEFDPNTWVYKGSPQAQTPPPANIDTLRKKYGL